MPAWLLKQCISVATRIINMLLDSGVVPIKKALVRPLLKKPSLDADCRKDYIPMSNLSFISKQIERNSPHPYAKQYHACNVQGEGRYPSPHACNGPGEGGHPSPPACNGPGKVGILLLLHAMDKGKVGILLLLLAMDQGKVGILLLLQAMDQGKVDILLLLHAMDQGRWASFSSCMQWTRVRW